MPLPSNKKPVIEVYMDVPTQKRSDIELTTAEGSVPLQLPKKKKKKKKKVL